MVMAIFAITTCDTPLGLGDPVDVNAPSIFITSPSDNQFLKNIQKGSPIELTGSWIDDNVVTEITFEIYNRTFSRNAPFRVEGKPEITHDGSMEGKSCPSGRRNG
jgi:hypothetical protein